jgi:hypothetical protein
MNSLFWEPPPKLATPTRRVIKCVRLIVLSIAISEKLLENFDSDLALFFVSDHRFQIDLAHRRGTHRKEGTFIHAGPGILPCTDSLDLSVCDVAPTVLAGLGLPVACEISGHLCLQLFDLPPSPQFIDSYEQGASHQTLDRIDKSAEEQVRWLGYVE